MAIKYGKKKTPSKPPIGGMSGALLAEYNEIVKLVNKTRRQGCLARYEIAERLRNVRDGEGEGNQYGKNAVLLVARALKKSKSWAYAQANVVDAWKRNEFEALAGQKDASGHALSWSHFVELAAIANKRQRQRILDKTLKQSYSSREVRKAIKPSEPDSRDECSLMNEAALARPRRLAVALAELKTQRTTLTSNWATWNVQLAEQIKHAEPADLEVKLLQDLENEQTAWKKLAGEVTRDLKSCIDTIIRKRKEANNQK